MGGMKCGIKESAGITKWKTRSTRKKGNPNFEESPSLLQCLSHDKDFSAKSFTCVIPMDLLGQYTNKCGEDEDDKSEQG